MRIIIVYWLCAMCIIDININYMIWTKLYKWLLSEKKNYIVIIYNKCVSTIITIITNSVSFKYNIDYYSK